LEEQLQHGAIPEEEANRHESRIKRVIQIHLTQQSAGLSLSETAEKLC